MATAFGDGAPRMRLPSLTLLALLLAAPRAHGQLSTVGLANMPAPGVGGGAQVYQFTKSVSGAQTSLNNDGQTALLGRMIGGLGGVTSDTDTGIWIDAGGSLTLVAREGTQAPGTPAGAVFSELSRDPVLNDAGQTAFPAYLREGAGGVTASNNAGIWAQRGGQLQLVARTGNAAPGTPAGVNFGSFTANSYGDGFFAFNNAGQTAFTATLMSSGGVVSSNDSGIWSDLGGTLALIAREGMQAPGAPAGAVFDDLTTKSPVLNNNGQLAVTAQLRVGPGGVVTDNNFGIWLADKDGASLVVREGSTAPTPAGAIFRHLSDVQINDPGSLLFRAQLSQGAGGVTENNDDSLWLRRNDELALAAREGSQVPGAPAGAKFGAFNAYALNNHHRIAASGYLQLSSGGVTADNNGVLWSGLPGNLRITAREGDLAPGGQGAVFADFFFEPNINASGKVAFMATLKPNVGGVDVTNDRGIWATDAAGTLHLIAREGDQLEVAPGDIRTITALGFRGNSGNADGRYSVFNDRGEVQFWAQFDSSEGVFISELVASDPLPADFNQDGAVDGVDLQTWRTGYNSAQPVTAEDGDANGDLVVDGADFLAWQQQVSSGSATVVAAAIPEPTSLLLTIVAIVAVRFARNSSRVSDPNDI
jgi:hypothetical protein